MPQVVYMDRLDDMTTKVVDTIGSQPGPIGGDGWSLVSRLPQARLQNSHRYCFWVTGKAGNFRWTGSTPGDGVAQLCLGDSSGLKHPQYLTELHFADALLANEALPFTFLVIFSASPAISDPIWGSSWANTSELQLHGRIWRRNDPPTYAGSFDVYDLQWVWVDMDAIPAGDVLATRVEPATPTQIGAGPGWTTLGVGSNTPGADGDQWLHLFSVVYRTGAGVPQFQVGYATDGAFSGFTAKHGTIGKWGVGYRGSTPRYSIGAFWVEAQVGAAYLPAIRGRMSPGGSGQWHRIDVVSIRLEDLTDVTIDTATVVDDLADNILSGLDSRYAPLEIAPAGRVSGPWVMVCGSIDLLQVQRHAHDWWITTNLGQTPWVSSGYLSCNGNQEAPPCYANALRGIGPRDLAVQYRFRFLGLRTDQTARDVRDYWVCVVYPVKDPSRIGALPGAVGNPTEIVPGREGPGVGSLLDPPLAPDVEVSERSLRHRESLVGANAYRRTWGLFLESRRLFALRWAPVSTADRDALLAFLDGNVFFRITPPKDQAIAVARVGAHSSQTIDHRRHAVEVEVAELIWTDP